MTELFTTDGARPEISVVDPMFLTLRKSMGLKPNARVDSVPYHLMTLKQYYGDYVS